MSLDGVVGFCVLCVDQPAAPGGEPVAEVGQCLAGDAVLGEVVGIEQVGLSERVGEDPSVESTIGAVRQAEESFFGVAAGPERGVDVDEVTGERPSVERAYLVRDRVVGVQDRSDGHEDGVVGAPVDPEFHLGHTVADGDDQPGERVVCRSVSTVRPSSR